MLGWAIGFFIAALVAAVFGFGGIASAFTGIAIILFWVFLALFVLSLLFNTFGGTHAASTWRQRAHVRDHRADRGRCAACLCVGR